MQDEYQAICALEQLAQTLLPAQAKAASDAARVLRQAYIRRAFKGRYDVPVVLNIATKVYKVIGYLPIAESMLTQQWQVHVPIHDRTVNYFIENPADLKPPEVVRLTARIGERSLPGGSRVIVHLLEAPSKEDAQKLVKHRAIHIPSPHVITAMDFTAIPADDIEPAYCDWRYGK